MSSPEDPYPALTRAVSQALTRHGKTDDPVERAALLGQLLTALHEQVLTVADERDEALLGAVQTVGLSHRALAQQLGISPQRVDRLVTLARQRQARED